MSIRQHNTALPNLLARLWHHLSRRRRLQFGLLVVLMLVSAFAEVVSLGAVLPFLGILVAPEQVLNHPIVTAAIRRHSGSSPRRARGQSWLHKHTLPLVKQKQAHPWINHPRNQLRRPTD